MIYNFLWVQYDILVSYTLSKASLFFCCGEDVYNLFFLCFLQFWFEGGIAIATSIVIGEELNTHLLPIFAGFQERSLCILGLYHHYSTIVPSLDAAGRKAVLVFFLVCASLSPAQLSWYSSVWVNSFSENGNSDQLYLKWIIEIFNS